MVPMFPKAKKFSKALLIIVLTMVLLLASFLGWFYTLMSISKSQINTSTDIRDYAQYIKEIKYSENHMPELTELGTYEEISMQKKAKKYLLWSIETMSLVVKYDKSTFETEMTRIQSFYSFLSSKKEYLSDYEAIVNGYTIKIVDKNEKFESDYAYNYPKCFMMIGVNEEEQSISYMFHYSFDLDKIDNLDKFIEKYY